jgi:hypothetical protein
MMKQIMASIGAMGVLTGLLSVSVAAQAQSDTTKVKPAAAVGTRTVPRTPDGRPDLQGLWNNAAPMGAVHSLEEGQDPTSEIIVGRSGAGDAGPIIIVDPADGKIPYQPAAAARRRQLLVDTFTPTKIEHIDPHARSALDGVPRINFVPGGLQIREVAGYLVILYESNHSYRVIPMDGRPHPGKDIKLWMGDSRGRWEGNTLVVDVTNFNEDTWFDAHGTFHSDALHVVERWTMDGPDRINYEVTIEDPKVFAKPWKIAFAINRNKTAGHEYWEDARFEGERDVERILEGGQREKDAGRTGIHEHRRADAIRSK